MKDKILSTQIEICLKILKSTCESPVEVEEVYEDIMSLRQLQDISNYEKEFGEFEVNNEE